MQHPLAAGATRALLVFIAGLVGACFTDDESSPEPKASEDGEEKETDQAEGEQSGADEGAADPSCRTKKVDLLFVIDNSGSMSEEQAKLAHTVPSLLGILATGNRNGKRSNAGEPTDFVPADSIHIGVIS